MSKARVIIHTDLDYFFAQCEERRDPSLRNKPVVVCVYSGRGEDSGAVSTANYIARKYGVKAGIPIALAKKMLKNVNAAFIPVNHEFYEAVSEEIMEILRSHADRFEQVSIDEAFLDVTKRVNGSFERAEELAQTIKEEILTKEGLTCSVGIGPNKLVAKIAAGHRKPDGLTVVKPEEVVSFLSTLPIEKLYGVGKKTRVVMHELGIKTIGELSAYDTGELIKTFGKTLGTYFHNASKGIDEEEVRERGMPEQIGRMITLKENSRELTVLLEEVHRLSEEVYKTAAERNLGFRSYAIIAILEDLSIHTRSKTFENPVDDEEVVKKASKELLERLLQEEPNLQVRRIGVKVSNFVEGRKQRRLTEFLANS